MPLLCSGSSALSAAQPRPHKAVILGVGLDVASPLTPAGESLCEGSPSGPRSSGNTRKLSGTSLGADLFLLLIVYQSEQILRASRICKPRFGVYAYIIDEI
jgi:hypothetical protein